MLQNNYSQQFDFYITPINLNKCIEHKLTIYIYIVYFKF